MDLSVFLDGGESEPRDHFTLGYHTFAWARDAYLVFCHNDGKRARLYDLRQDPQMKTNIAAANLDVLNRMHNGYILKDAGGSIPNY